MWTQTHTTAAHWSCGGTFSFYRDLIGRFWAGGPDETAAAPIHRLCTLARKMHVRSVLIEDAHWRPDVQAEIAHLEEWSETQPGQTSAVAVSFLSVDVPKARRPQPALRPGQLIGQAIIVTFPTTDGPRSFVHQAVFQVPRSGRRTPQLLLNNYVPIAREFTLSIKGTDVAIVGSLFHQQNGLTSVCVHSAVRSLLGNVGGIATTTRELNSFWGFRHERGGVDTSMVCDAFRHHGLLAIPYDLSDRHATGPSAEECTWRTLSCLAESATAAILAFEPVGPASHLVAVVGFTLNTDEWLPHAAPTHLEGRSTEESSSAWIDHVVIHDDLLGPYYCLSKADLFEKATGQRATLKPKQAIALLPSGVETSPVTAEETARAAFKKLIPILRRIEWLSGPWWEILSHSDCRRVYRTTLVSREAYISGLRSGPLGKSSRVSWDNDLDSYEAHLPERVWLVEVTLPQLFVGNRAGLGEVLIKVGIPSDNEFEAVAGFRVPGLLAWGAVESGQFVARAVSVRRHRPLHTPLYHGNGW